MSAEVVRLFLIKPGEISRVQVIMAEAGANRARVDLLKYHIIQKEIDPQIGLPAFQQAARAEVLKAHRVAPGQVSIKGEITSVFSEHFKHITFEGICLWRDNDGRRLALGQLDYFRTPLVEKLLSLHQPDKNGQWVAALCWNLGSPRQYLDPNYFTFVNVHPLSRTFLFQDERDQLEDTGRVVTEVVKEVHPTSKRLLAEGFEGYLIKDALFKIRAWYRVNRARGQII